MGPLIAVVGCATDSRTVELKLNNPAHARKAAEELGRELVRREEERHLIGAFDQVLNQHDTSLKLSNFIDTLQHVIPLYGEGVMSRLQQINLNPLSLTLTQPTLDDVFLQVTGQRLATQENTPEPVV